MGRQAMGHGWRRTAVVLTATVAMAAGLLAVAVRPAAAVATSTITTIAGTGTSGNSPDGTPATAAALGQPFGVATDAFGDTLIADADNGLVRMIAAADCTASCPYGVAPTTAGSIYTIAGGGPTAPSPTAVPARTASLSFPAALAIEPSADVVVADGGGSIDLIEGHACASACPFGLATESIGDIVQIAGGGQGTPSPTPQPGTSVSLVSPTGVAVDSRGDILDVEYEGYGTYQSNGAVLFVAASGCGAGCPFAAPSTTAAGDLVLLGGTGTSQPGTSPQPVSSVSFGYLNGDAITPRGDLVLTDVQGEGGNGLVELLAGSACTSACPYGTPALAPGDLVVVAGGGTQVLSGTPPVTPSTAALDWQIQLPGGLSVDPSGNIAVADRNGNQVVLVAATSCASWCPLGLASMVPGQAYLAVGTGTQGYSGDGGPPAAAELSYPQTASFAPGESLLIADSGNEAVRLVTTPAAPPPPPPPPVADGHGYRLDGRDGGVFAFGDAAFFGSLPQRHLVPAAPVVGMAPTPDGQGYWLVGSDGGVFAFGDAAFFGSLPQRGSRPSAPIVGVAARPGGDGYWLVGSDGAVYAFGAARDLGSDTGHPPAAAVTGIAATADGNGYWLVDADGGVAAFGDAARLGSLPQLGDHPAAPIAGIAATSDGKGYWLVGEDGGVFAFGDAPFDGSLLSAGIVPAAPISGIAGTRDGAGYRLDGTDGGVFAFGDAEFLGSLPALHLPPFAPISGVSGRTRPAT